MEASGTRTAWTAARTYSQKSEHGLVLHVVSSTNGIEYDRMALLGIPLVHQPGKTTRRTIDLNPNGYFIKVLIGNTDESQGVSNVKVIATLGG